MESPTTVKSGAISPNVIRHLRKVEKEMEIIDIWCEIKLPETRDSAEPQLLRAHPSLDKFGGFFDWVDAKFDFFDEPPDESDDDDSHSADEIYVAPAKLLAFYVDGEGVECAIVHPVAWSGGNETALVNTRSVSYQHLTLPTTDRL